VLLAVSQAIDIQSDIIPRIATGLAGGVGSHGEVCGALTGGVLVIGLLYGNDIPDDEVKYACYDKTSQFVERFKLVNAHIRCRELLQIDLTSDPDFETYKALNLREKVCNAVIHNAVSSLMDLLDEWG